MTLFVGMFGKFRRVFIFWFFRIRTMDEVQTLIDSVCYTPSSDPYRIYSLLCYPNFIILFANSCQRSLSRAWWIQSALCQVSIIITVYFN
jgi:hypothetical protein